MPVDSSSVTLDHSSRISRVVYLISVIGPYFFQIDLRDDPKTIAKLNNMKEKPVATEQGQKLAKEVGGGDALLSASGTIVVC